MRIKTVGTISEFLHGNEALCHEVKRLNKRFNKHGLTAALTTVGGSLALTVKASAAGPTEHIKQAAKEKIVEAFDPLVELVQALSYPIGLVMLTGGALCFMIGQRDKGISLIQNASIGYILVQLMPLMMQILVGIGGSVGFATPLLFV